MKASWEVLPAPPPSLMNEGLKCLAQRPAFHGGFTTSMKVQNSRSGAMIIIPHRQNVFK
jgi:hypothetical protein